MQPSKPFLIVLPPVILPPTQLVIEGYFLILKHTHSHTHLLIPLSFFPSKCLVIHGYAMTLFLSEVLPTFPRSYFSLLWMTAAVSSAAFLYIHVHTCRHTHTQNSSAKQKPAHAISLLKTLEWLPKMLKIK